MKQTIPQTYTVVPISYSQIKDWLLHKHYAHRIPSISYAFGCYDDNGILQAVCSFGVPASPSLVKGAFNGAYTDNFLELNRLCASDGLERNVLSYFVSSCLKLLPKPKVIVSYADSGMNHHGYIYQATNWIYTGLSDAHSEYIVDGNKHSRHLFDELGGINKAKECGLELKVGNRSRKHRYFYLLGNKSEIKNMKRKLKYQQQPYPKGDNIRYDASYKPTVQMCLFLDL